MIKHIFEKPLSDRVRRYLELAELAEGRAAKADAIEKESYEKLAIEWRHLAASVKDD